MNSGHRRTRNESLLKHLAIAFGLAILIYLGAFYLLEHSRTRKGGWQVTFQTDADGHPTLWFAQPHLGISNVSVSFPGGQVGPSNLLSVVVFDRPITNVPFGRVIYVDTTFQPGSVVFGLFGHEIQLLPRVLMLDKREIPWLSGTPYSLLSTNRLP